MGILLKGILAAVPCESGGCKLETKNIYIDDGKIISMDKAPENFAAEKTLDGRNKLAIPGLINAHTHSYMSLFRNVADDLPFEQWLFGNISPLEDKLRPEDAYWGACLAILEMMKSGSTCFCDMQMHIHQTTRAAAEAGMRAVICRGLVGSGNDEAGQSRLREAYEEMKRWKSCSRLSFRLGPHAPYTCDPEFLSIVASQAQEHSLGIHIHLSESENEVAQCREKYGCSPIALAEREGLFDVPALAAHCVYISPEDMDILKEKQVSVVTNPASNMKLGNGFAPIPAMLEKGVNVCLGTDGASSNNSLNLFHELRLLSLVHKGVACTAQAVSAQEAFSMATENGAKALGLNTGRLETGATADIAILNLNTPSLTPRNNLIAGLCYSAGGDEVESVIIDGKFTMENRNVLTLDEERIYFEVDKICRRLELDKRF